MDRLYLNFHLQTDRSPQMDDCRFPQGGSDPSNGPNCSFPSYQPHIVQRDLTEPSGEHMDRGSWEADTTSLNPLSGPAVEYWPEQYQKHSFSKPPEAEIDQTENSSTASCCSMGEAPSMRLSEADTHDDSWLDSVQHSSSSDQSVSKKYKGRTTFSAEQLRVLQQRFQLQRYVSASERQDLGNALGLSSQQVKTWFQNRRMKVKRILKEPLDVPQIGFLQTDLTRNNPVVYGKPSDYVKQHFEHYSLPRMLPRELVSAPSKQWPSPGSVYPSLGKFQSTVIKSELQYTNKSVNFSIKKEAIELSSCQPELDPTKSQVTAYSHALPVQHFDFSSLQRAMTRPGLLQQGPARPGLLQQGPARPGLLQQGPARPGLLQQGPARPGLLQQGPARPGLLQQGPARPGLLQQGPTRPGLLQQGPARPGLLQQGPTLRKPAGDELQYERVIIS